MRYEQHDADVVVIGGGLAGVAAAIAAARLGSSVSLITNRPVLGGNSSSEVRVWVVGATSNGRNRYARETGIIGELLVENQYTNPEGNPYYWDLVVLDAVRREPGIRLYLNTDVRNVSISDTVPRSIESVTGWMMGSEREIEFTGRIFLDCTGDGLVGHLAGARSRVGREGRDVYGEPWAPEVGDDITLGSTILFYTKDVGHPVPFVPPSFAKDLASTTIPEQRVIRTGADGCFYWWIEWGGELDTVHENDAIRDELWSVIYGIWDYIKHSGRFDAESLALEWVGAVPGKREYRRFIGDYTLTQHDILAQTPFDDRVAFGGWSIDLHPPAGMYANAGGSRHWYPDGPYDIPFGSLHGPDVRNLLFAGRDISASHVAFGTTRVMATCAVVGQAAGTAAAMAARLGLTPAEVGASRLAELQRTLVREDASPLGVAADDPDDILRDGSATSSWTLEELSAHGEHDLRRLDTALGLVIPVDPVLDTIRFRVDAEADTRLTATIFTTGRPQNFVPAKEVATLTVDVAQGEDAVAEFAFDWRPPEAANIFLTLDPNPDVAVRLTRSAPPGVLAFDRVTPQHDHEADQLTAIWKNESERRVPQFEVVGTTNAYGSGKVLGGYTRPYGGPQMWVSRVVDEGETPSLEVELPQARVISELHVIFDDDLQVDLNNLHRIRTPYRVMPTLVRSYRVLGLVDGIWRELAHETENRRRRRILRIDPVACRAVRLIVDRTNGDTRARIVALRAYSSPTTRSSDVVDFREVRV